MEVYGEDMIEVWIGVLALAVLSCYQDLRVHKVYNGLIGVTIGYAIGLAIMNESAQSVLVNASIALFCGLVLWWCDVWAAGDAKLFVAYAALIPVSLNQDPILVFPLLVNSVIPASVVFLIDDVRQWPLEAIKEATIKVITTVLCVLLGSGVAVFVGESNPVMVLGIGFLPMLIPQLRKVFAAGGAITGIILMMYAIPLSSEIIVVIGVAAGVTLLQMPAKESGWRAGAPWLALGAILTLFLGKTIFSVLF